MRPVVYIATPISRGNLDHNIGQANEAMLILMRRGISPINPVGSCFVGYPELKEPAVLSCGLSHQEWIDMDLELVARSVGVLRLPGDSLGADKETAHARSLGIPVFDSIDAVLIHFGRQGN